MIILNCLIKLHFPEVFTHLKALSVPIEWYFEEAFESLYAECFSSDIVLRLWDMIILSSTNGENKKKSQWWLLAIPIYMIKVNNDLILQTQSPEIIKDLLTSATAASIYNPSDFIEALLKIIHDVFVERDNVFNRVLKNDDPNQLEKMRFEVERSFLRENGQELNFAGELAQKIMTQRPHIEVNIPAGKRTEEELYLEEKAKVRFRLVALRNVQQLENSSFQITLGYARKSD
jgi:hypothetical protein